MSKRILIIGGGGYIGTRLCNNLHEVGHLVHSVDLNWYSNGTFLIYPYQTEVIDCNQLRPNYYTTFDVIIFLAAHASVKMCDGYGLSAFYNNLANFIPILHALQNTNIKLIYASSSSVYINSGASEQKEWQETTTPNNFYDLTKRDMDLYASLFNVESYGLRFGTVNGWSEHRRIDIMLNAMYESAVTNNKIKAFNIKYHRPVLGMSDLVKGVNAIINTTEDCRGVYNLASFNSSIEDIAKNAANYLKCDLELHENMDPRVYDFSINCDKFKKNFNFTFTETIESILESLKKSSVIKTHRNNPQYYYK